MGPTLALGDTVSRYLDSVFGSWSPLGVLLSLALLPFSVPRNGSSRPAAGREGLSQELQQKSWAGAHFGSWVLCPPNPSLWRSSCDPLLARKILSFAQESGVGQPHVNYLV